MRERHHRCWALRSEAGKSVLFRTPVCPAGNSDLAIANDGFAPKRTMPNCIWQSCQGLAGNFPGNNDECRRYGRGDIRLDPKSRCWATCWLMLRGGVNDLKRVIRKCCFVIGRSCLRSQATIKHLFRDNFYYLTVRGVPAKLAEDQQRGRGNGPPNRLRPRFDR